MKAGTCKAFRVPVITTQLLREDTEEFLMSTKWCYQMGHPAHCPSEGLYICDKTSSLQSTNLIDEMDGIARKDFEWAVLSTVISDGKLAFLTSTSRRTKNVKNSWTPTLLSKTSSSFDSVWSGWETKQTGKFRPKFTTSAQPCQTQINLWMRDSVQEENKGRKVLESNKRKI